MKPTDQPGDTPTPEPSLVAPEWYAQPELRPALTGHDVAEIYRALRREGLSQRRIGTLAGHSQSEVSEILKGRQVREYRVLVRVAGGLGIPPKRMGLSFWGPDGVWYGPGDAYPERVTVAHTPEGVSADMLRRHLIALSGAAMVGAPVAKLGELLDALHHYAQALELARQAGDAYCQAIALRYSGMASAEHGHPDDGLKMLQCAQVAAWRIPPDGERAVVVGETGRAAVEAAGLANAASVLGLLGAPETADVWLAKGRELWAPTSADPFGDLDRPAAQLELQRGRLDVAEQLAAASLRRWEGGSLISRTLTSIVLSTIHVKAGEPRGLQLAHSAIASAAKLSSVRVRSQLAPLAAALEARPGSDARELARMARQVAA